MESAVLKTDYIEYLGKGIDFNTYFQEFRQSVEAYKIGELESQYSEYLPINFQRLKRGLNKAVPSNALIEIITNIKPITWLVLTEPWCGDAAQSLGFLNKIAEASNHKIQLKLLYRDKNLGLMDCFLTDGGRSIPKLLQLDDQFNLTGTWGPRPKKAQELVMQLKTEGKPYSDALHLWYARDKYKSIDLDIQNLLKNRNNS